MPKRHKLTLISFAFMGVFLTIVPEVLAVIGRPLTPVSFAGVARRSVRRSTVYPGYPY